MRIAELPEDWEHFEPAMEKALNRLPALEHVGIQLFFNGPESFTPDDRYLIGEAPNLKNFFVAAGFNSVGIQSAGGVGMVLSEWMVNGRPPMDVSDVDIRRCMPFQGNRKYLHDRTVEGLGLLYAMHWPFRQYETARNVRRSPLHDRLPPVEHALARRRDGSARTGLPHLGLNLNTSIAMAVKTGLPMRPRNTKRCVKA